MVKMKDLPEYPEFRLKLKHVRLVEAPVKYLQTWLGGGEFVPNVMDWEQLV
jgi:hypothetical protein